MSKLARKAWLGAGNSTDEENTKSTLSTQTGHKLERRITRGHNYYTFQDFDGKIFHFFSEKTAEKIIAAETWETWNRNVCRRGKYGGAGVLVRVPGNWLVCVSSTYACCRHGVHYAKRADVRPSGHSSRHIAHEVALGRRRSFDFPKNQ